MNAVYVLLVWVLILSEQIRLGMILLGAYFVAGALYALAFVLPAHLKAKKLYGVPQPPLDFTLGPIDQRTRTVLEGMKVIETKLRRSFLGKKSLHTLYECGVETEDGLWNYSVETRDERLLAWCFEFQSSKSSLLDYSRRSGYGYYFAVD